MSLGGTLRDRMRTLLRIRTERGLPPQTPKPGIGAKICRDDVRMTLQAGVSSGLWQWLLNQGWREITHRPDRRRYLDVPPSYVTRLIDCVPEQRGLVMAKAIEAAHFRSPQSGDR